MYRTAVDVGGTFTDLILLEETSGELAVSKAPSTPVDPSIGVVNGLRKLNIEFSMVSEFIHATTVATNSLVQRTGPKVCLITTQGFRDVLEIMREERDEPYNYQWDRPQPLVPRHLRVEVPERVNCDGEVVVPLDEQRAIEAVKYLKEQQVEAIAICFLFSFLNPAHEKMMGRIVEEVLPGTPVSISSEVLPEIREYGRSSTVTIDAYLKPIIEKYLSGLEEGVKAMGYRHEISLFKSNGGITSVEEARRSPVQIMSSGPAGGVVATQFVADLIGRSNVIGIDMGGTSFDVSLLTQGAIPYTTEMEIEWGIPVRIPFVDVLSIGAGGGTIAWFDMAGALKVGPMSAGAEPGPACYGAGGEEPTVTDANLVLGRLNPENFLGGGMPLYPEAAEEAIAGKIGSVLGRDVVGCAQGIIDVVNANMAQAVRVISVEKGYDPREFSLCAFGGAGAMHASAIARWLDIPEVIVPNYAGLFSALGLLVADLRIDQIQSYPVRFDDLRVERLSELFGEMEAKALDQARRERFAGDILISRSMDMRYVGQNFEIEVPLWTGEFKEEDRGRILDAFNERYQRLYTYFTGDPREVVTLRLTLAGRKPKPTLPKVSKDLKRGGALKGYRNVFFEGEALSCAVYDGGLLSEGEKLEGPAIIEKMDTTIVTHPGEVVTVDEFGNLLVKLS